MNKKHTFKLNAPDAQMVLLAGDFTDWEKSAIRMRHKKNGEWEAAVKLDPGVHRYRFIVDDQWMDDPGCPMHLPNPYGGQDAAVQIA